MTVTVMEAVTVTATVIVTGRLRVRVCGAEGGSAEATTSGCSADPPHRQQPLTQQHLWHCGCFFAPPAATVGP